MKKLLICSVIIALSTLARVSPGCEVQAQSSTPSQMIIDVETSSQKGVLFFEIKGQRIPDNDLLGFLNRHWDKYSEDAVPIVMIPASLTVLEIGLIEATFSKAGYHKIRLFLYAKNSDFVEELIIKEPVRAEVIRGSIHVKK